MNCVVVGIVATVAVVLFCLWRLSQPSRPYEDIWGPFDGDAEAD